MSLGLCSGHELASSPLQTPARSDSAAGVSLEPAQARQHALRARERGVCGSRWTRLCENVDRYFNLLHIIIHNI